MEEREVVHGDGAKNKITYFKSAIPSETVLVCLPALGVRASYYEQFARTLAAKGFNVVTVDWRGHGHSSERPSSKIDFGYQQLIDDLGDVMELVDELFPNSRRLIVGHSLGGQIGSLYAARDKASVQGLILITSCAVYYKGWSGWDRVKVYVAGNAFFPLSKLVGYFPGNLLSFGGKEARQVMGDWSYNAMNGEYKLAGSDFDYEQQMKETQINILSITIKDDWMASYEAAKNLYSKFHRESNVQHLHVGPEETKIEKLNHFNWTRHSDYFVNEINTWFAKL